jgi:hypothetical protein
MTPILTPAFGFTYLSSAANDLYMTDNTTVTASIPMINVTIASHLLQI